MTRYAGVTHTTADPTANFTAYAISSTSGGLSSETLKGLDISLTGLAGDSSATFHGIDLNYTAAGTTPTAHAVSIDANWDLGLDSSAPCQVFVGAGATDPALQLSNIGTAAPGLQVYGTGTSTACPAIHVNTNNTSTTEGTANAVRFLLAKTLRVYLDPTSFVTSHTFSSPDYEPDFGLVAVDESAPISVYWTCRFGGSASYDMRLMLPLPVPHEAVVTNIQVWGYGGGGTLPTTTNRPRLELLESPGTTGSSNYTILSTAYASSMDLFTFSISPSLTVDRANHSYNLRFRTALANTSSFPLLYAARVSYQITDLGAAVSTNSQ
jgi:hypothetical protein